MKFKVDENLPEDLSQRFRIAGWDSLTVDEQRLSGEIDPRLAEICASEERILVTFDRGFSNIRSYPPSNSPGMIVFRLESQDKRHVLSVAEGLIDMPDSSRSSSAEPIVHPAFSRALRLLAFISPRPLGWPVETAPADPCTNRARVRQPRTHEQVCPPSSVVIS